ncbi:MAG: nuclear transport factor 2 family protein [Lewinellaceae bacterium]|nr:nuclear transport factor 2 family protein [Saprospiraceae bacterium]MCB9338387.1 nuclear transport factor 2 family protein [Lewinellaceae bacterium]
MRMRLFLLFLFLTAIQPTLFSQHKNELQLKALELQRFEAMTKKDIPFLENVLSDDLTYNHSNGLAENKTEHIQNINTGDLVYKTMQSEDLKVRIYKKTAVLNGLVRVTGILKDREFNIRLRYTDVYVKRKGKWQLVAWHSMKAE